MDFLEVINKSDQDLDHIRHSTPSVLAPLEFVYNCNGQLWHTTSSYLKY